MNGKLRFEKKVAETISKHHMLEQRERVIVGLSGGADSVALFYVLLSLGYDLSAAHINHGLRGTEADEDEAYVVRLCANASVPLEVFHVDIRKEARTLGITEEEAGRKNRYACFEIVRKKYGATKIAVGHNMNDQAETMLMRIIRGSGLEGLTGIPAVRGGIVIRPLLEHTRDEIETYLLDGAIPFRTDSTNSSEIYTRNKIRLQLLPYIKEELNPEIISALARASDLLAEDNDFLEQCAKAAYHQVAVPDNRGVRLRKAALGDCHDSIKARVIRRACLETIGSLKDISYEHIASVLSLMTKETGKKVTLPYNLSVENCYDNILFRKNDESDNNGFSYALEFDKLLYIETAARYITLSEKKLDGLHGLKNISTKFFDYDKVSGNLTVRSRLDGDKITFRNMGTKKIKDYFIDIKLERGMRDKVPLIADGCNILWIIGYGYSSLFSDAEETKETKLYQRPAVIQIWEDK